MRDLGQRPLGVAEQQDVGLRVEQNRATHFLGPVVVVGNAAQACLNAADHQRHITKGLAQTLTVDDDAAVGTFAALAARGVGVVAAHASIGRIAINHRVHVARGDAEEQVRTAERLERGRAAPVGLRDDAHAKALRLEKASDDRHAETGVVHVGVARHQNDVAAVPPQRIQLFAGHGQHGRGREPVRPVLAIAEQRGCGSAGCGRRDFHGRCIPVTVSRARIKSALDAPHKPKLTRPSCCSATGRFATC